MNKIDIGTSVLPTIEQQKEYFHANLRGRKISVWVAGAARELVLALADVISKVAIALFNSEGKMDCLHSAPGMRFTWYNRIDLKGLKRPNLPALYLGMIPQEKHVTGVDLPKGAQFVSIVQDFEYECIPDQMRGKATRIEAEVVDNRGMTVKAICKGVDLLEEKMNSGTPVYLHCKSGVGRSATVLGAWLTQQYVNQGISVEDALNQAISEVQKSRPDAQLKDVWGRDTKHTEALRNWAKNLEKNHSSLTVVIRK